MILKDAENINTHADKHTLKATPVIKKCEIIDGEIVHIHTSTKYWSKL